MSDKRERPSPEQDGKTGRFVSGNIGGGRPKGSRNKLAEAFIADLQADWEENGVAVIQTVRAEKPADYMKIIAGILPKDLNINVNQFDDMTDDDIRREIRNLHDQFGAFLGFASDGDAGDGTKAQTIN